MKARKAAPFSSNSEREGVAPVALPPEGATQAPVMEQPVTPEKIVKALKEKGKWMK